MSEVALKASIITVHVVTLSVLAIVFLYIMPDRWLLDYRSINVQDICVGDLSVIAQSERYPTVTLTAFGEDNIYVYPLNGDFPLDRVEWSNATYRRGTNGDRWIVELHRPLKEGTYVLVGEIILKVGPFPRPIDPIISESFNVIICDQTK